MMAKGVIRFDDPYAIGTIGIPQKDYQDLLLAQADLLLCVGYDIVELAPARLDPKLDKTIIHVNTTAAHVNRCYPPAIEVIGDMAETFGAVPCLIAFHAAQAASHHKAAPLHPGAGPLRLSKKSREVSEGSQAR